MMSIVIWRIDVIIPLLRRLSVPQLVNDSVLYCIVLCCILLYCVVLHAKGLRSVLCKFAGTRRLKVDIYILEHSGRILPVAICSRSFTRGWDFCWGLLARVIIVYGSWRFRVGVLLE